MKRNRIRQFYSFKQNRPPRTQSYQDNGAARMIVWENDYYHFKQQLKLLEARNLNMQNMIHQYQANPSVFNLKQLDSQINVNCHKIDSIQHWANSFPYSRDSHLQYELEKNLVKHIKSSLFQEIKQIFSYRQQITDITTAANARQRPFNAFTQPVNVSYSSLNNSVGGGAQRTSAMREVTARIENLNAIVRRMGDVVVAQGQLINRIDENLIEGHAYVKKGGEKLGQRLKREQEGVDQFSCSGKINKVIMGMYFINLALIFILVIKNL